MAFPTSRSAGMVHACGVSLGDNRVAPNSFTRSRPALDQRATRSLFASDASETSPCRRAGQAKQRARPPKGNRFRQANSRGIETSVSRGRLPSAASAQLESSSVVGPHRRAMGPSRSSKAGRRREGQSKANGVGRGPQRDVCGLAVPEKRLVHAVAGIAPVRPAAPRAGPVVASGCARHGLFISKGSSIARCLLLVRRAAAADMACQLLRNRFGSNGVCLRHRW
jgi:hypothetical protein